MRGRRRSDRPHPLALVTKKRRLLLGAGDRYPEILLRVYAKGRAGKVGQQRLDLRVADRCALDGL